MLNKPIATRSLTIPDLTKDEIEQFFDLVKPERAWATTDEIAETLEREKEKPETDTQELIRKVCSDFADFLVAKNKQYGNSALRPRRVLSSATPEEQLLVRMDDKINRLLQGDNDHETVEEAIKDLLGYYILLQVVRQLADD